MATGTPGRPGGDWHSQALHTGDDIWPAIDLVVHALEAAGFSAKHAFAARLALEEAISNGLRHGNKGDPAKAVHLRWCVADDRLRAEVEDEGSGFNPAAVPDPLAPENLDREGGRGILLIRSYMTAVSFNDRGNCIRMELAKA
jgi:serine/threonine-protein kinase RsbW